MDEGGEEDKETVTEGSSREKGGEMRRIERGRGKMRCTIFVTQKTVPAVQSMVTE